MNGLCCDCDIHPLDGDNICIGRDLICSFPQKTIITGKATDEHEHYSYLIITNAFNQLNFGRCNRGMYSATPTEILHTVLLHL